MGEEFEKDKTVDENNITEEISKTRKPKKRIIIAIIVGIVLGLFLLFTFSSYKLLFAPKKASFLTYFTSDMYKVKTLLENITDNELVDFITDGETKKVDLAVNLDSKELSGSTIFNKDFLALNLNNITENYLLLENKNLDKLWGNLGLNSEDLPKKIDFKDVSVSLTNGEKRKIYNFVTKCSYNIVDNLENEKFILTSEKSIDINGETKNLKSIEIQLSETDLLMLQKEALTSLKDEGIVNLLVKKVNKISNSETVSKSELNAEIEKYIAYLDYAKAYYDLQDEESEYYIIYRMYCDDSNNVVAREITEKYIYEGTLYEDIIARIVTDENGFYEVKIFSQEEYNNAYYNIISDIVTTEGNKQSHDITYKIEGFYIEYPESGEDYNYVPLNSSVTYNLSIETDENGLNKINFVDENNIYSFNMEYNLDMAEAELISSIDKLKVNVKIKNEAETQENLINNNAVVLNNMTQEELIQTIGSIGNKIMEIFAE